MTFTWLMLVPAVLLLFSILILLHLHHLQQKYKRELDELEEMFKEGEQYDQEKKN